MTMTTGIAMAGLDTVIAMLTGPREALRRPTGSWLPSRAKVRLRLVLLSRLILTRKCLQYSVPGDRGSNITVVGLIANLALCGAKGVAGVWLHSASLLADAAHSLSDTFSDIVTLFCWKMSQRPASLSHPLGYGKFETMGGLGVSVVLVAGALAIGLHSYGLLLEVLQPALLNAPKSIQAIGSLTGHWASAAGAHLHEHHHAVSSAVPPDAASAVLGAAEATASSSSQAGAATALDAHGQGENLLDPNAMWFALISILVKEWLYRATLKIAKEENSSVLEVGFGEIANAHVL